MGFEDGTFGVVVVGGTEDPDVGAVAVDGGDEGFEEVEGGVRGEVLVLS